MSYYIYSTLTNDQHYADYAIPDSKEMLPVLKSKIFVKGGSGVSNKHFITPHGTVTEVTDEEYSILKGNSEFVKHLNGGFLRVEQRKYAPEKIAKDMGLDERSSPLTPDNYSKRIPVLPGTSEEDKPKASTGKRAA